MVPRAPAALLYNRARNPQKPTTPTEFTSPLFYYGNPHLPGGGGKTCRRPGSLYNLLQIINGIVRVSNCVSACVCVCVCDEDSLLPIIQFLFCHAKGPCGCCCCWVPITSGCLVDRNTRGHERCDTIGISNHYSTRALYGQGIMRTQATQHILDRAHQQLEHFVEMLQGHHRAHTHAQPPPIMAYTLSLIFMYDDDDDDWISERSGRTIPRPCQPASNDILR